MLDFRGGIFDALGDHSLEVLVLCELGLHLVSQFTTLDQLVNYLVELLSMELDVLTLLAQNL